MSDDYKPHETDWVANCSYGYGFGYTKEQALAEMAAHVTKTVETLDVTLMEHVGNVRVFPNAVEADTVVSEETVTLQGDDVQELHNAQFEQAVTVEEALANAE